MVTAAQVGERFGLGRAVTYARLGGMVRLGFLEHARIFHGQPGVYLATRSGLSIADLELPPARVDIRTYAHDLELSSVVVELEREFGPERIKTERETRAADTDPRTFAHEAAALRGGDLGGARPAPTHARGTPTAALPRLRRRRCLRRGCRRSASRRARTDCERADTAAPNPRRIRRRQTHRCCALLRSRRARPRSRRARSRSAAR